ncbi:MAG: glycosyltransferase family 39 protein [Candidatus Auribacterota bacterium]|nr:glycosyltransferase family 39 protein [Candidatus Auribacterota bacterium]
MKYRKFLVLLWLIPLVLYYSDRNDGPDHVTYRIVAEKIFKDGHLNILGSCGNGHPREVSPTFHHPIFQTIGGAVFFIPPMIMAPLSRYLSSFFPIWPDRFQSLSYHQSIWERFIAWLLGFWACLLVYRVARIYYSARAAGTAVALCALGGPILIFVARWPCQTNLPTAFLSALLLYVYHFADRRKYLFWFLMGAIWGFGVFVRNEFIVWALLPAYGIILEIRSGERWQRIGLQGVLLALSAGCFLVATFLIQVILYGRWGNTYSILIDPKLLAEMLRMLFGPRNGLFSFWPVLFLAIIGYIIKFRANPGINHLLFGIIISAIAVCTVFPFWLALGGQRPILMVMPCFMIFLARLLDCKRRFFWLLLIIGIGCIFWAVLIFFIYSNGWVQDDGSIGFLKANTLPEMFKFVFGHATAFFPNVFSFCFMPKQKSIWLILPFLLPIFLFIVVLQKIISRGKALILLAAGLSIFCIVILIFLAGAGKRGKKFYNSISQTQPEGWYIYNSRYHLGEYFINSLDFVAYYLEYNQPDMAAYFEERAVKLLRKLAPQHIQEFRQVCEAFRIRHSLGWKRIFPVGLAEDPVLWLRWYYKDQDDSPSLERFQSFFSEIRDSKGHGIALPLNNYNFRSDFKNTINNYRIPGELLQR